MALLQLGAAERVWPLLEHQPDPRLRSFLIHRFEPLKSDVQALLGRLETEGEVSRRAAFVRNNGTVADPTTKKQVPSFTIISNRCTHVGCPTQANGPQGPILGKPTIHKHTANGPVEFVPVIPAGYGCPCHGSQFDTEGNRTAGPAVRALDRYGFEIDNGRLILLSTYSVSHVVGTGAQAKIYKYKEAGPGQHVDGPEQWFYPLQPPHH